MIKWWHERFFLWKLCIWCNPNVNIFIYLCVCACTTKLEDIDITVPVVVISGWLKYSYFSSWMISYIFQTLYFEQIYYPHSKRTTEIQLKNRQFKSASIFELFSPKVSHETFPIYNINILYQVIHHPVTWHCKDLFIAFWFLP